MYRIVGDFIKSIKYKNVLAKPHELRIGHKILFFPISKSFLYAGHVAS